jgi:hypothetical protein
LAHRFFAVETHSGGPRPTLRALLAALRGAGVQVDAKLDESEYGNFGWVMDLDDGNRVELWEPPAPK